MTDLEIASAYDSRAAEYIELAGEISQMDARDRDGIAAWREGTEGALLDAGCGPGLWTEFLHDGHREATGIDLSEEFLAAARQRYPHLRFQHGSFRSLPFDDASLGGILAWYSLIHIPPQDIPAILSEFARVLVPGGSLLIGYFHGAPREPFAHAVAPAYFWTADALTGLLAGAGLTATRAETRPREPGEVSHRPHGSVTAQRPGRNAPGHPA